MSYIRVSLVEDKKVTDDGVVDLGDSKITIEEVKEQLKFMIESENKTEFSFGTTIEMLKNGFKMARKGWGGNGAFVYYVPANIYKAQTEIIKKEFGEEVSYDPYLAIKNQRGTITMFTPGMDSILAEDWIIVE